MSTTDQSGNTNSAAPRTWGEFLRSCHKDGEGWAGYIGTAAAAPAAGAPPPAAPASPPGLEEADTSMESACSSLNASMHSPEELAAMMAVITAELARRQPAL